MAKLEIENHGFEGSLPKNRTAFKISSNAKLFSILSDGIYQDKIMAVIRELSCNAQDAEITRAKQLGKPYNRFTVGIPTDLDPTFFVEDNGIGIDPDKIGDIFWTYGESTKTNSNDDIGALGLGSKSPFAYTKSTYTVVNRYNGKKHTYLCFINEQGIPDGSEVSVEDTDRPNGVRVELAVHTADVGVFMQKIRSFFRYWKPEHLPKFEGRNPTVEHPTVLFSGTDWVYESRSNNYDTGNAIVVMGGVPYPLDLSAIPNAGPELSFMASNAFVINFPIGSLSFQASREGLSYEPNTVAALKAKAAQIKADVVAVAKAEITKAGTNPYDLQAKFKKIVDELKQKFRNFNAGHGAIGVFKDTDKFKTTSGQEFTALQLYSDIFEASEAGHSILSIMKANGNSATGRWSVKQARMVELQAEVDKDALDPSKGKRTVTLNLPWFRPTTKPDAKALPTAPAKRLHEGYKVTETRFEFEYTLHDQRLTFVLNDLGTRGGLNFRHHANKQRMNQKNTFFVDCEKGFTPADFGAADIAKMFEGSIFEGLDVVRLSHLPNFELLKEEPRESRTPTVRAPYVRGSVELPIINLEFLKHHGEDAAYTISSHWGSVSYSKPHKPARDYVRFVPTDIDMLYVMTAKGGSFDADDKFFMVDHPVRLSALFMAGAFDKYVVDDTTVPIVCLKSYDELEALKAKGATFARLSDVAKEFLGSKKLLDACKEASEIIHVADDARSNNIEAYPVFVETLIKGISPASPLIPMLNEFKDKSFKKFGTPAKPTELALIYLAAKINNALPSSPTMISTSDRIFGRYPLVRATIRAVSNISTWDNKHNEHYKVLGNHLALYVNGVDEAHIEKKFNSKDADVNEAVLEAFD